MLKNQLEYHSLSNTFGCIIQNVNLKDIFALDSAEIIKIFREFGTLLFKNFDNNADTFIKFTNLFCQDFSTYQGGGFRWKTVDRESINNNDTLLSTTGNTQGFPIPLHGEMYYLKNKPNLLCFYCDNPPSKAGETTICSGIAVFNNLTESTKQFLKNNKIKYIRHLADGEWQTAFQTNDLSVMHKFCDENETKLSINPQTGAITTEYVCSAIVKSQDGQDVFINNILTIYMTEWAFETGWISKNLSEISGRSCPLVVRMEDNSRIPNDIIEEIKQVTESLTTDIIWQKGDILMIDNTKILHGRREAIGSDRRIYVRMGKPAFSLQELVSISQ